MNNNQDGVVILPDSGERTEFESGAVRDIQTGKGRCDLLPLDVVSALIKAPELILVEQFKDTKDVTKLYLAIEQFATTTKTDIYTLMIEVSKHFESGAVKYGDNNWKKGIGLHYYLSSAIRHFFKFKRADMDEPHDRAFVWNLLCAAWTYIHKPELDDVEGRSASCIAKEVGMNSACGLAHGLLKKQLGAHSPSSGLPKELERK